jgi:GT2 family glycosyltransferase
MSHDAVPSQAIIVCTRDRPDDVRRCLPSVLQARLPGSPVVIVDQSRADDTEAVVRALMADHDGIDYFRSTRTGAATARNEGAVRVDEDLLLFTDDDCEVDPDWARAWTELFASHPRVGLGFGRVTAPPYDFASGTIPAFDPGPGTQVFGPEVLRQGPVRLGMGANMAMRRSAWQQTGGFDESFGPGTELPAAEETDLAIRVLDLGYDMSHSSEPDVVHHGFRAASTAARLFHGYWLAGGAMYGKHIRAGDRRAIMWSLRELWGLCDRTLRAVLTGVRPTGFNCVRFFVKGLAVAVRKPVDRTLRVYRRPPEPVAQPSYQLSGE